MKFRILTPLMIVMTAAAFYTALNFPGHAVSPARAEGGTAPSVSNDPSGGRSAYEQNTIDIVKKYGGSVVAVNVTVRGTRVNPLENVPQELRPFFKQFMPPGFSEPQQLVERAAGSGFVVDDEDHIITNYHVVREALAGDSAKIADNAKVTVRFQGQSKDLPVKVVGVDQSYDLALLQVDKAGDIPSGVTPIPIADSDKVEVGEKAIAIGNPFGLQSTVTQGIVSAVNRKQEALASGVPIAYIQTDAAINPGNSGGPLLDSEGEVIGINDQILAPNGTFIGVGFAIPSNLLREHLTQLKGGGFIKKAQIGVSIMSLSDYPDSVRQALNLPAYGVMVVRVLQDSPADKAGLEGAQFTVNAGGQQWPAGGDIILKIDGRKVEDASQLQSTIFNKHAGDVVELQVLHGGHRKTVKVTLAILKRDQQNSMMGNQ